MQPEIRTNPLSDSNVATSNRKGRQDSANRARWLSKAASNQAERSSLGSRQLPVALLTDIDARLVDKSDRRRPMVEINPKTWLLVLSEHGNPDEVARAIKWGRTFSINRDLQHRLREILAEIAADVGHLPQSPTNPPTAHGTAAASICLTQRQAQIAMMVRDGASNKLIAKALGVTVGTVKVHLHRIFRALGVENRIQLAMQAHSITINGNSGTGDHRAAQSQSSADDANQRRHQRIHRRTLQTAKRAKR